MVANDEGDVGVVWGELDPDSGFDKLLCKGADGKDAQCPNPFFVKGTVMQAGGAFSEAVKISAERGGEAPEEPIEEKKQREREESVRTTFGGRMAIDAVGNTRVVWSYYDGTDVIIQTAERPVSLPRDWRLPKTISSAGENAGEPDIGMDSAGNAIAVWLQNEGPNRVIKSADAPLEADFGSPQNISPAGLTSDSPSIAVNRSGAATAVWRLTGKSENLIQASSRPPGGSFGAPVNVSLGNDNPLFPRLAMNERGDVAVAWSGDKSASEVARASVRLVGGGFSDPTPISPTSLDLFHPEPALGGSGDATVTWLRSNGVHDIAQVAGYDASPPGVQGLSVPATGRVGVPVQFSASPFDIWPISPVTFNFGDGSGAVGNSVSHVYGSAGTYPVTAIATDAAGTQTARSGSILIKPRGSITLGKLKRNWKKGNATLAVTVDGAGHRDRDRQALQEDDQESSRGGHLQDPRQAEGQGRQAARGQRKTRGADQGLLHSGGGDRGQRGSESHPVQEAGLTPFLPTRLRRR